MGGQAGRQAAGRASLPAPHRWLQALQRSCNLCPHIVLRRSQHLQGEGGAGSACRAGTAGRLGSVGRQAGEAAYVCVTPVAHTHM